MTRLTRHEQLVITSIILLLLAGWAVKVYRTANPPAESKTQLPDK